jgi:hypothetical protein
MTDERTEDQGDDEGDVGFVGGGGPAATMDEGDDEELDEHGDNLREGDPVDG